MKLPMFKFVWDVARGCCLLAFLQAPLTSHALPLTSSNLLVNGDFEHGLNGWNFTVDPNATPGITPGTTSVGGTSVFRVNPGSNGDRLFAGGTLSQPFPVHAGHIYTLSAGFVGMKNLRIDSNEEGGVISFLVDGSEQFSLIVGHMFGEELFTDSFTTSFVAPLTGTSSMNVRLTRSFTNLRDDGTFVIEHYLDNVSVIGKIPEPGSVALVVLGAAAAFGFRRRFPAAI